MCCELVDRHVQAVLEATVSKVLNSVHFKKYFSPEMLTATLLNYCFCMHVCDRFVFATVGC